MQLSSSVTKSAYAVKGKKIEISTNYKKESEKPEVEENNIKEECYKDVVNEILESAKKEKEKIIMHAMERASKLEREGYEKGYKQGVYNGIEDAKKKAKEEIIPKAISISEEIVQNAEEILKKATEDYNNYLKSKEKEIKKLSFTIAERILNKKINEDEFFISMIENALEEAKGEKTILIKCNEVNIPIVEENIERWKLTLGIKEGIFSIKDNLPEGEVIIEKETGIIKTGIETGLEKLKEELLGR